MRGVIKTEALNIDVIKSAHPIKDIIAPYVKLKRTGRNYVGLCPFHDERTPSFTVYTGDERFHCFGCGAHGDLFDFLYHMERLDLKAVVHKLTGGTMDASNEAIEALRAKRAAADAERAKAAAEATQKAKERWQAATTDIVWHDYLDRKAIEPHGIRLEGTRLLIPLFDADGEVQTVQSIAPDGRKLFETEAPVIGGRFVIGGTVEDAQGAVLLCEGFATGASLHEATGLVTVCTFSGANLVAVAQSLSERYRDKSFLVCGDDDRLKKDNMGREYALRAAEVLDCGVVFPVFGQHGTGTDFNDMARESGYEAIVSLIENSDTAGNGNNADLFDLYDFDQLDALPPPNWLVHEYIVDDGLSVIYGDPAAGKSFIAVDMALRLAYGIDWHGRDTNQTGVLYIAGEGARGIGKRMSGWRHQNGLWGVPAPLKVLPVAVELMVEPQRDKLLRTLDHEIATAGFKVGLVIVDTVSRALAGADENSQESMGAFVKACDEIRHHIGGALLGVHHSGKDSERGMRGSSVLLGACDAVFKVTKMGHLVTIENQKQKDAEEADQVVLEMEEVAWAVGFRPEQKTLVPKLYERPADNQVDAEQISSAMVHRAFSRIANAWNSGNPLSHHSRAKTDGRYAASVLARDIGGLTEEWESLIISWLENECLVFDLADARNKKRGLRVERIPQC